MGNEESKQGAAAAEVEQLRRRVAELEQAVQALEVETERHQRLLETTLDGYILADTRGQVLDVNPSYCRTIGYTRDELLGMNIIDLEAALSPAEVADKIDQMVAAGSARFETKHRRKDGRLIDLEVSVAVFNTSRGPRVAAFVRDVTEQKRIAQQLQDRVRQLTALNALSQRVSTRLDLQEVICHGLQALTEAVEADVAMLFLRRGDELELAGVWPGVEPFSQGKIPLHRVGQCLCGLATESGRAVYSSDIFDDPRCTWRECKEAGFRSFAALPLLGRDGVFGVIGLASVRPRDFAREGTFLETLANGLSGALQRGQLYEELRARAEQLSKANEEIRRLSLELERRVEERTKSLAAANEDLEAFAYSVSHDLRAPLRALEGFARALVEDYAERLGTEGRQYCQYIMHSAARMDQLITDLLAYSRLGRAEMRLEPVDLAQVVEQSVKQVEPEVRASGGEVVVEGDFPPVLGHKPTLLQVVMNLVSNALKFVAPGVHPRVRIWAERRQGRVRLWVEDNGVGIAPEHQERIFRVFERLHGIERYPGTGIGLAIVHRATRRMGGRCGVESAPGQGSRFWVEYSAAGVSEQKA